MRGENQSPSDRSGCNVLYTMSSIDGFDVTLIAPHILNPAYRLRSYPAGPSTAHRLTFHPTGRSRRGA